MTTLAVIESNRTKAELLCHYLATRRGLEVVAMECSAASALRALERVKPDVILASLTMPDCSAADIITQLRTVAPVAKFVGLVSQCTEYLVHSVTKPGCHGLFFDAGEGLAGLADAMEHVLHGRRFISAAIMGYQLGLRTIPDAFPKILSKREMETLICIAHTMTDEEIGLRLGISAGTAQSHRKRIMGKLGIHSTPKLIGYCLAKGFQTAALPSPTVRNERNDDACPRLKGRQLQPAS
jgi:DNA-binding NarL/FixJ family response regulator